jgi:pimeloyl-ACP methyl ester carboxylesterase
MIAASIPVIAARSAPGAQSGDAAGPPVLLVHGFGSDHASTWASSGWTAALDAADRRWIAVDLPGHGTAARPADPAAYALEELVAGLAAVAREEGPVDLVGYSLGGELALRLAGAQPGFARRVVAGGIGTHPPPDLGAVAGIPLDAALLACAEGVQQSPRDPAALTAFSGRTLLFAGTEDPIADGLDVLADAMEDAEVVWLGRRHHRSTLSASTLKRRAIAFLAEG